MHNVRTCLWYDNDALEAARFYAEVFDEAEVGEITRTDFTFPEEAGGNDSAAEDDGEGRVLLVEFTVGDQRYIGLNGGPQFPQSETVSIEIVCSDQAEVDRYWEAITSNGGQESNCGWCKDRFGLSWQIVPQRLYELMADPDRERSARAMNAMLGMHKIDVAALEAAVDGTAPAH